MNVVGLRRSGLPDDVVSQVRNAYKKLYRDGQPITVAVDELRGTELFEVPQVQTFCDWVTEHVGGAVKGRLQEAQQH